jgi:hypothetical protein
MEMKTKKQYLKPTVRVIGLKLSSGLSDPILVSERNNGRGTGTPSSFNEENPPPSS